MRRRVFAMAMAVALFGAATTEAHHALTIVYLMDKTETIEGDLTELRWQNPHSLVFVSVRDKAGAVQRYSVEWEAGLQLTHQGVMPDTLKAGDHLIITGNPGRRAGDHILRLRTVFRPKDGWRWRGTFE